ncbi:MAG: hypothetical protein M1838_005188 [Thelocarpon superellum]|nr:MAG: hypothetical protein M1838_005188 [Thelocarpon superellum]
MAISFPQLLLAGLVLLGVYITFRCIRPPNAEPTTVLPNDRVGLGRSRFFFQFMTVTLGLAHAYLLTTLDGPGSTPAPRRDVCPNPQNLNPTLFTWAAYPLSLLLVLLVAGSCRLYAFATLGSSFTFKLAPPKKLITTGMYAYVQHPSYTAAILNVLATLLLFARPDAALACWLPPAAMPRALPVFGLVLVGWSVVMLRALAERIEVEEGMMEQTFGDEWRAWHQRTPRFIPCFF